MLTFKQFLTEDFKTKISIDEAIALINQHCSDFWNNRKLRTQPILRGDMGGNNGSQCYIFHGEAGNRKSRHTSNHYTVILDKALEEYPKRSKSLICGNFANKEHVLNYGGYSLGDDEQYGRAGEIYAIIPYNGVKIGICPKYDMFDTPVKIGDVTDEINEWNRLYNRLDIPDTSFEDIVEGLENAVKDTELSDSLTKRLDVFRDKDIATLLTDCYGSADFQLATTANPGRILNSWPRELWIGGKCIAIPLKLYQAAIL